MMDVAAVLRALDHIERQLSDLRDEIAKCASGEYSPFMDSAQFELIVGDALTLMGTERTKVCFIDGPHRCSRCDGLVRHFMARSKDAA
jgi:hypothetical protein